MTGKQKKMLARILTAGGLFAVGLLLEHIFPDFLKGWVAIVLLLGAWALAGYPVLLEAIENIGHGQIFDENLLMSIATIGALGLKDWGEAAAVMLFFEVGELFESVAVYRSRQSISALMNLRPDSATVLEDGREIIREPEEVKMGDILLVKPGERIPVDGVITEGSATLDTSKITGESVPAEVGPEDSVISGCVNLSGVLKIRAQSEYAQSTVAKILELVESASDQKATSERLITRFARYYTPTVVIAAILLAVLPPLTMSLSWAVWIKRALTFLVISCPCALVISVPLSYFGGMGAASKLGIVVKGGTVLERIAKAQIAVFDKTGTLTTGQFSVNRVEAKGVDRSTLLNLAAAAEYYSSHPVSAAIKREAGMPEIEPEETEEIPGCGLCATVRGIRVLAGNHKLMERHSISCAQAEGDGTVIYVAANGKYLGYIVIGDTVRPNAKETLRELKKCGIRKNVMLTGDIETAAEKAAKETGIDEYHARLLPQDKVTKMQELLRQKEQDGSVIFAGDGVNDAPVLALADVGIAMGGVGSDAAVEAADVVILNDDISKLPKTIRIARKTNRIAMENIIFALGVKAAILVLGALGYAPMWAAIFADVGVAIIAILNAIRTMYCK